LFGLLISFENIDPTSEYFLTILLNVDILYPIIFSMCVTTNIGTINV